MPRLRTMFEYFVSPGSLRRPCSEPVRYSMTTVSLSRPLTSLKAASVRPSTSTRNLNTLKGSLRCGAMTTPVRPAGLRSCDCDDGEADEREDQRGAENDEAQRCESAAAGSALCPAQRLQGEHECAEARQHGKALRVDGIAEL